ncbi:MliC family protein [Alteromonas sp. 14N.309.X.WAT.G.H12]|uniref:MliC family protein n=1 Tax=Alteromonas sp. 14N.309.X.WAT.G.H12 TaxID=3120824 RepID=UPI002FD6A599
MKYVLILGAALALLNGCNGEKEVPSKPNEEAVIQVDFACSADVTFHVQFYQQQPLAVLTWNNADIRLTEQPSGSGFIYSNDTITLRGKGNEATLTFADMPPFHCRAK